jgi:hypothetical protein
MENIADFQPFAKNNNKIDGDGDFDDIGWSSSRLDNVLLFSRASR